MFGLEALDLIIGLITIYLAFGIAATACVEAISSLFKLRAKNLEDALGEMLAGEDADRKQLIDKLYEHPLVYTLSKGHKGRPSYLPKAVVSKVVESLVLVRDKSESLMDAINKLPEQYGDKPNQLKALLIQLATDAGDNAEQFKANLEQHFDHVMERATGWYKRRIQTITLVISLLLAGLGNVDTIAMTRTLSANPEARAQLLMTAATLVEQGKPEPSAEVTDVSIEETADKTHTALLEFDQAKAMAQSASVEIGWDAHNTPDDFWGWVSKLIGLLVSAFAISLGAPFWFNTLQKLAQLRATGAPQQTGNEVQK